MSENTNWLLPSGIKEFRPPQAEQFFNLQQRALQTLFNYGYQLIMPPAVEYAKSLIFNDDSDLERELVVIGGYDQNPLGLRADFTPQAARIDTDGGHLASNRICYSGEVFRRSSASAQNPYHLGAELFGESGLEADLEVITLLLDCIGKVHSGECTLSLGHAALYNRVLKISGLDGKDIKAYRHLLAYKSVDRIQEFITARKLPRPIGLFLEELPRLYGDESVFHRAEEMVNCFKEGREEVLEPLKQLQKLCQELAHRNQFDVQVFIDLGENSGIGSAYHTGPVFGVYLPGESICVAKGGRYDAIGSHYYKNLQEHHTKNTGRSATGFSMDLREIFRSLCAQQQSFVSLAPCIFAPYAPKDENLRQTVRALRNKNKRVLCACASPESAATFNCSHQLTLKQGQWEIEEVKKT